MDQETILSADFAQVIFHNVAENYPPEAHIQCSYTLSKSILPNKNDWVGLFKIGWSSSREKITYDWAPLPLDRKEGQEYKQFILFKSYYLPKQDGEFYQFCYIDVLGKMKGASTPFQFLYITDVEFVEIDDELEDMLMIQSRSIIQEAKLKHAMDEKQRMLVENQELIKTKEDLAKELAGVAEALANSEVNMEELQKTHEELQVNLRVIEEQKDIMENKLCQASDRIKKLEEENARHKTMLESTEADLKEVVAFNNQLSSIKDQLTTELLELSKEKDEYKIQFSSSEQESKVLEQKLNILSQQLLINSSESNEQEEEKRKIEQEILVARADRDYWKSHEDRLKQVDGQLAATEQTKYMLTEELATLKTVQCKLSNDLENASIEKDSLNGKLLRSSNDFKKKEKKLLQQVIRQEHAFREKEALLQEQLKVMRHSMNKLAKDHERLQKNVKDTVAGGPSEALKVALDDLTAKLKRRNTRYDELYKQKVELEKKLATIELQKRDLFKDRDDCKTRIAMAAEEYKAKYVECHYLQRKLNTADKKQQLGNITDGMVKKEATSKLQQTCVAASDKETQSGLPAATLQSVPDHLVEEARDKTFDTFEIKQQLQTMEEELTKRDQKIRKYKKLYQEEKNKCEGLVEKQRDLHERLVEEAKLKEGIKIEFDIIYQQKEITIEQLQLDLKALQSAYSLYSSGQTQDDASSPPPPPQSIYVNPYTSEELPNFKNPYAADTSHVVVFQPKREVNNLDVDGAQVSLLPPKNPPTMNLPEPMVPVITPEAKIAAMKNVQKKNTTAINELDPVKRPDQLGSPAPEDDRDDVAAEFHDAQEFPVDTPVQKCPECQLVFPPTFCEQQFLEHLSTHAGKHCPMCEFVSSPESSQSEFEEHVQSHFMD